MFGKVFDLANNVTHALEIHPPDYVRSILGNPDSWRVESCPPTELQLAEFREWSKGLPALAHILIPAVPWKPPGLSIPFSDELFRPSVVFRYPAGANVPNPTPEQSWFFINDICTDHNVVMLNGRYLNQLFKRPLTVIHNFTRGIIADLAACAVGKEWDVITESAAVAFPPIYAALKNDACERLILLTHSQGTILGAVVLALLKHLHPRLHAQLAKAQTAPGPEHEVARKLAKRWDFDRSIEAPQKRRDGEAAPLPSFEWPGHGKRQPEPITTKELQKLEIYCVANCATEMVPVKLRGANGVAAPWTESYGNENDLVARLGVLANVSGPGSVRIGGDRYKCGGAWGHLLNAHYLFPMMEARKSGDRTGGLAAMEGNRLTVPRLFGYLDGKSARALN